VDDTNALHITHVFTAKHRTLLCEYSAETIQQTGSTLPKSRQNIKCLVYFLTHSVADTVKLLLLASKCETVNSQQLPRVSSVDISSMYVRSE